MKSNFKLFLVGGCIRDSLLGIPFKDIDLVCLASSFSDLEKEIIELGGKIFLSKPEYLTCRCFIPKIGNCDIRLAREDGKYLDGRHPEKVKIALSIEKDLSSRDFTVNALAKNLDTDEILDPFHGIQDIQNRIIRAVGNPYARFDEDKLRVIRACRFAIQKKFTIEQATLDAMYQFGGDDFKGVSTERLQQEFFKMFSCDTFMSIHYLFNKFPRLGHLMVERNIWLKPTLEEKKA